MRIALDSKGVIALAKLPVPYNTAAAIASANNRKKIKAKMGSNGLFVKLSAVSPFFAGAKKRTRKNMKKRPKPW